MKTDIKDTLFKVIEFEANSKKSKKNYKLKVTTAVVKTVTTSPSSR